MFDLHFQTQRQPILGDPGAVCRNGMKEKPEGGGTRRGARLKFLKNTLKKGTESHLISVAQIYFYLRGTNSKTTSRPDILAT